MVCPANEDILDESRMGEIFDAVPIGGPEDSTPDGPRIVREVACSRAEDRRDCIGDNTVACPMADDASDKREAAKLGPARVGLIPSAPDKEGSRVGKAIEVLPRIDERRDCFSGMFVALPSFDVNPPNADGS